jgi:hypothetical protein
VRADQVVGIDAHQTPALSGKPARWLLDVVLPASIGSGTRDGWAVTTVHPALIQTAEDPTADAAAALARLLAQLDLGNTAGVITTSHEEDSASPWCPRPSPPDPGGCGSASPPSQPDPEEDVRG